MGTNSVYFLFGIPIGEDTYKQNDLSSEWKFVWIKVHFKMQISMAQ